MMTLSRPAFLSVMLLLLTVSNTAAQNTNDPDPEIKFWGHYSAGISTLGPANAIGLGVDYHRHTFSVRTSATDTSPVNDTWDLAIMYGRSTMAGSFNLTGGVGAAVIAGEQYSGLVNGTAEGTMEPMLAFPLEGHLSLPVTQTLTIGIYSFANINTNQPFGGLSASIRIGRLY